MLNDKLKEFTMQYMKRANIYQASNYNVTFNPKTLDAVSYKWWRFVACIDGVVLFNSFRYSVSTAKHQHKVRSLLNELGIKIDVELQLPRGIRHDQPLAELYLEAEEEACNAFLHEQAKLISRNERAAKRRVEKRQAADAKFKANIDSITLEDVIAHRKAKLQLVLAGE